MSAAAHKTHDYTARLVWDGNLGEGTSSYTRYGRQHHVEIAGKPDLAGSSDPAFRGDPARHNPEDLFLTAIAACHMLFFLSLCARHKLRVVAYEDDVRGTMSVDGRGGGKFEEVVLHPRATFAAGTTAADVERAAELHETAHELCFIANSCSVPIHHQPSFRIEGRIEGRVEGEEGG
jgi:organic hydroperoxide reductase OsmC/OhrA